MLKGACDRQRQKGLMEDVWVVLFSTISAAILARVQMDLFTASMIMRRAKP